MKHFLPGASCPVLERPGEVLLQVQSFMHANPSVLKSGGFSDLVPAY